MRLTMLPRLLAAALIAISSLFATAAPAAAGHGALLGKVTDAATGAAIADVCVTIGPPVRCVTLTKADGTYFVSLEGAPDGLKWDLGYYRNNAGCATNPNGPSCAYLATSIPGVVVTGPTTVNAPLNRDPSAPPPVQTGCLPARADLPTATNYLPNITKTLGGPNGFQTPFITQNTGTTNATLEISFYKFSDGSCVKRLTVTKTPGTSFAFVPNNDSGLPDDSQFSVVVRSYGATIVSVVNQHQGSGARAEALSYVGASEGAKTVSLPNITRRFFGFVTPFIIQNLGTSATTANAQFLPRGGTSSPITVLRVIEPGRSQFVDPNSTPGLVDGTAYSVSVTASEPIAVIVNTHKDAATEEFPVAYSANGVSGGAETVYGPYAAKNAQGIGRLSTIVTQNVGTAISTPVLKLTPLGGGTTTSFALGSLNAGASRAFDPRYTDGDTAKAFCGPAASAGCLGDGEYSFEVTATGGLVAVAVNVISNATAMGYSATGQPAVKYFLPNVTRTLGGAAGWTTPILLQSVTATSATLKWYRFSDGSIVHTQTVPIAPATGLRIDPRTVSALADDTQYSVIIEGTGGTVTAIVVELADGGDNAMIYEGFPAAAPAATTASAGTPSDPAP